ncbi:hypothetical protein AVEN_205434-1 [Araneus ventricosus]|uniref:Reverse transcriptase RNase H-like domain-containing protein n=1 Tax=Araneus ventricosus TaxID=182803 RepID=A0A4Y2C7N3_ARAVE|nr:hypothetical protein AVEN_193679-1 [Araneus ventricosus]GBL99885.1 hypothetical protein AVEN_120666-1 [Araneus ventricosus]GBL99903.1 hypothetical protein AVEN_141417-1 [Araneus ventricosus]GBL99921.1 hypothetical protein AVEN_205434-1 [Araneus ventricosus]
MDHVALGWLQTKKELKGRLARWGIQLQEHTFQVIPRTGVQMAAADALSRNPVGPAGDTTHPDYMIFDALCVNLEEVWLEQ